MLPVASRRSPARITLRAAGILTPVVLVGVLAACTPVPGPAATPTATSSAIATSPSATPDPSGSPSQTATPAATDAPSASIQLPGSCEAIYSDALLATMADMPLNDPGVTLLSTEMTAGLEVLEAAPTIRCAWGQPSEFGLATNVSIVDAAQSQTLEQSMRDTGMTCADYEQGTLCRIETEHLQDDDVIAKTGETHYLRDNAWIATHWINFSPEGYTEDIVATLWG
jgi:hypothetical protein